MSEFQLKTAIPSYSDSTGLAASGEVYFSSNTHVFKLQNRKYTLAASCEGTIKKLAVHLQHVVMCTADRVYLSSGRSMIGSLKRTACAVDVCSTFFAIGVENMLEVWRVPTEYKFTLFSLQSKHMGHSRPIKFIRIVSSTEVLTAADDCTVRLFNIAKRECRILASLSDVPKGLHYDETARVVYATSANGGVLRFELNTGEYRNLKFDGEISASASCGGVLAVSLDNVAVTREGDELTGEKPRREVSKTPLLVILKDFEEVYRGEMTHRVAELAMVKDSLVVRTAGFIGGYSIHSGAFEYIVDLPKILSISQLGNTIAAACGDGRVRIYREACCVATLLDPDAKGEISKVHLAPGVCITVHNTGHVSAFNIADAHCFRSFKVAAESLGAMSSSCASEDACVLYVSDQSSVRAIDIMRSKLVETVGLKSPVISMAFHRGHLYTVELDYTLTKTNVFSGVSDSVAMEHTPTNLAVRDTSVLVSTVRDVVIYDLDLNFVGSFAAHLEGRRRDEVYSKPKAVEQLDFTARYVFCGGESNLVKIYEQAGPGSLMKTLHVQTLRVSRNKDWENYKTRLDREKETKFDKEHVIKTRQICADGDTVYVLASDGLSIYGKNAVRFSALEFDVVASEEYVKEAMTRGEDHKALIAALRMGNGALVRLVIDKSKDKSLLIRHVPERHAQTLLEMLITWVKEDFTSIELIGMAWQLAKLHGIGCPGLSKVIQDGTRKIYEEVKRNKYLLDLMKQ